MRTQVDFDELRAARDSLRHITETFADLSAAAFGNVTAIDVAAECGLARALNEYGRAWDHAMTEISEQLEGLATALDDAVTTYEGVEHQLSIALSGP